MSKLQRADFLAVAGLTAAALSVTERAVGAYSQIADPRLREIVTALIQHLHALVKELPLTEQEWEFAWDFMARMDGGSVLVALDGCKRVDRLWPA